MLEISRTIARLLGHRREEVLLEDVKSSCDIARHPWDPEHPIVLDTTAASELGYVPAGDFAGTVVAEVGLARVGLWRRESAHG